MQSFGELVAEVKPRLTRAFVAALGRERGQEALAEAMSWAAEHPDRLVAMDNPAGYLYRVGRSRSRHRRRPAPLFPSPESVGLPEIEPRLPEVLALLPTRQRVCVVLVVAEGWTYQEVAELLDVTRSTVQTHVERGMARLREELGVSSGVE